MPTSGLLGPGLNGPQPTWHLFNEVDVEATIKQVRVMLEKARHRGDEVSVSVVATQGEKTIEIRTSRT